jgi:hypothetical protein
LRLASATPCDLDWIVGLIDEVAAKPNRPARYKQAKGTTDTLNKGVTLQMADAHKPRG